jgi:hypothetical protein
METSDTIGPFLGLFTDIGENQAFPLIFYIHYIRTSHGRIYIPYDC